MDETVTHWINALAGSSALLDVIMVQITQFGVPLLVLLVILQWWSKVERIHIRHICVAAGLAFIFGLVINQIILLFVERVRPYDAGVSHLIVGRSSDWSFPSDHATAAFAIVTTFLLNGTVRRGIAFLAVGLMVAVSRVYVGTHYVTDVFGGAVTGGLAAFAVRLIYQEGTKLDRIVTGIL